MSSHCWNHPGEFDGIRIAAKRDQCAAVDVDRRGWGRGLAVDRADHGKFAALCRGDRRQLIVHQIIAAGTRSEEHTSELQSLMRISYAVFCLKKKTHNK